MMVDQKETSAWDSHRANVRRENAIHIMRDAISSTTTLNMSTEHAERLAEAAYVDLKKAGYVQ